MIQLKKVCKILFCLMMASVLTGYVRNLSPAGSVVHWPSGTNTIDVYVNSGNSQALSDAFVQNTTNDSVTQWNGHSNLTVRKNSSSGTDQEGVNEIYFSTNPAIFSGTSVEGVTVVTYRNSTGEILEADILINDNLRSNGDFRFSTLVNQDDYLGNVVTHELGHLLGLGHSQVIGSSMFYSLTRGQSQTASDDKAGVYSIYPTGDANKVSLSGKIVGGVKLATVFGAHVEAISVKTGKVEGAAISEIDGTFIIDGLVKNEQYHLYTKPVVLVGLPSKYAVARSNFCEANKSYRGSFFQSCGSSFEGFPQSVKLFSSNTNIGNLTIRCGLDVPTEYIQVKGITPATFDLLDNVTSGVGNTFSGYFSAQELASGTFADYFNFNLSSFDPNSFSLAGNLFLELKIANQTFFSPFKANITVYRNSSTVVVTPKYSVESDGWIKIDTIARIPISRLDLSDNDFEIKISPESMVPPSYPTGIPYNKDDLFPSLDDFEDNLNFYLVTATIVKENGDGTYTQISSKIDQLSDNTQCPDAVNTYSLNNYTVNGSSPSVTSKKKDNGFLGCGTIALEGDSGSGPTGFLLGLCLSFLLCSLSSKILNRYKSRTLVQDGRS